MMKVLPVIYGPEAESDLNRIYNYILTISSSPLTAGRYTKRLTAFCDKIGGMPGVGYEVEWKNRRYRRLVFERLIIVVYEVTSDTVEIVRVISGRRNLKAFLR